MRADASDEGCLQDPQSEEVGEARCFAGAIEIEPVPRVLPMGEWNVLYACFWSWRGRIRARSNLAARPSRHTRALST